MNATEEASFPAMRRRNEESEDDGLVTSNDSTIIRETLRFYGSLYLCCFFLYCVLRRRYPLLFNVRSWVPELECELAKREYGFFNWFWKVFDVTDEEIFKDCGMDAMCFLRALRMGRKLSLCGCFNAIWLIPLYATADESSETAYLAGDTWAEISVSNLPSSSERFLGTVLASYIVFFYSMYLLFHEFKWYTKWRHKFLSKPWSRNYAVYVSGIPLVFRSSFQLAEYFRQCSSKESVIEAHVTMDIPGLDAKVARREFVVRKLEHTVALERKKGCTKTHRKLGFRRGLEKVDSVSAFETELKTLNRDIERSVGTLKNSHHRFRSHLNRNAASGNLMAGSDEWLKEDSENAIADLQVLSSMSEGETEPLVNVLPAVSEEDSVAMSSPREEGAMAAVPENETLKYGKDGGFPRFDENETAVWGMSREESGISEDNGLAFPEEPMVVVSVPNTRSRLNSEDSRGGRRAYVEPIHDEENAMSKVAARRHRRLNSEDSRGGSRVSNDPVPDEGKANTGSRVNIVSAPDEGNIASRRRRRLNSEDSRGGRSPRGEPVPNEELFSRASSARSEISSKADSEHEIEFGPEEVGDDAVLFGPNVTFREPIKADSTHSVRSASSNGSSVSSSASAPASASFLRSSVSKSSRAASHASQSIATGSRQLGQSIATGSREKANAMTKAVKEFNPDKLIQSAHDKGAGTIKKAKKVGSSIVASAGSVVPMMLTKSEGKSTSAGFVLFSSLYAATSAIQMVHHPKPYVMDVQEAPDADDIFWRNVGLEHKAQRTGRGMSLGASAVLCFFWSIPMALIASLTELQSLKEALPVLGRWIEDHPKSEKIFAQAAPLLLLFFNDVILPGALKYFSTWEGFISSQMLEASLFVKLGAFMIIQTFFVSAISGGITAEISNMIENPESIIDLLANSLPAQSSYFIQILLATTFLMQSLEFLRVYQLGMAFLRHYVGPNVTKKEREETWAGINSLEDPPEFWHAETFAQLILYFMVFFVYAPIAPVTTFFLYFCFILLESGYRYQFIHNYPRPFDTGGKLWLVFIQFTLACMLISQLTLIGLLILKKSVFAGPAMGPLMAVTILFVIFINRKHTLVTKHLPTRDCIIVDRIHSENGVDNNYFARGKYLQPSLRATRVEPQYDEE